MSFGTIGKLAAIALGIMSTLALARDGLAFKLLPFLDATISAYGALLDSLFLDIALEAFEPFFHFLANWLDWNWKLYPHWKHAWVLLWLYLAAQARSINPPFIPGERYHPGWYVFKASRWTWTAFAALIGAGLAGTVPLDHPAVFWFPLAGYFLNSFGENIIYTTLKRLTAAISIVALALATMSFAFAIGRFVPISIDGETQLLWWGLAAYFVYQVCTDLIVTTERPMQVRVFDIVLAMLFGALAIGIVPGPSWLNFNASISPGLATLAAYFTILAAWHLLRAILAPADGNDNYVTRVFARNGPWVAIDILSVLGGAATIVYLGHVLA